MQRKRHLKTPDLIVAKHFHRETLLRIIFFERILFMTKNKTKQKQKTTIFCTLDVFKRFKRTLIIYFCNFLRLFTLSQMDDQQIRKTIYVCAGSTQHFEMGT